MQNLLSKEALGILDEWAGFSLLEGSGINSKGARCYRIHGVLCTKLLEFQVLSVIRSVGDLVQNAVGGRPQEVGHHLHLAGREDGSEGAPVDENYEQTFEAMT